MRTIVIVEVSHGGTGIGDWGVGNRESGIGNRESGIGNRESEKPGPRVAWVFAGRQVGGTSQRGRA
ncbi:hypothetical protein XcvCFBP7111P_17830 [Xanthomonas citri pv. vignicola]|uniref:Uncharacterized protein n=1 Tax=Xanthomonas citri pv. vignicola TaxID=473426 RepID=A0AB33CQZ6_XANCI|nr:hypothetical protein XcvCFBP7111P_17830 [Xanthomonas citri pv. vignicola]